MMTGNTHPRISNDDVRNLRIPVPEDDVQRTIVAEMQRRKTLARKLKQEAEQDWVVAKAQFEKELLGE
jgi:restriction endonuclease S subunit